MQTPKARIGMVAPLAVTDELPYEFYRLAADMGRWDVSLASSSIRLGAFSREGIEAADTHLDAAVEALMGKGAQWLVLGGLPVVSLKGQAAWRQRLDLLARRFGVPFPTDLDCVVEACRVLGVRRIAVADKWGREINDQLRADLTAFGSLEVVSVTAEPHTAAEVSTLRTEAGVEMCRRLTRRALQDAGTRPDAILLGGGAWYGMLVVPELEAELGVPVLTNPGCMMWCGLNAVDRFSPVRGWGELFTRLRSGGASGER